MKVKKGLGKLDLPDQFQGGNKMIKDTKITDKKQNYHLDSPAPIRRIIARHIDSRTGCVITDADLELQRKLDNG